MKSSKKKIAVVGGGILGRLLTLELFEQGQDVCLFEKGPRDGSSSCGYVGLGMICPWSELPNLPQDDFMTFDFGLKSLYLWPKILNKINSQQNYLNRGCLLISRREEQGNLEFIKTNEMSILDRNAIINLEPELNHHFYHGLFIENEGCLDTRILFQDLSKYFEEVGCQAVYQCGDVDRDKYDFVFDTRGLGAKSAQNNLRGVRGETLRVFAPGVTLSRLIRVVDSKLPLYIVPRGDYVYSLGATCVESEDVKPITVRSALEMLSMARYVHEGFMEANIIETNVQWRPAFIDNKINIIQEENFMSINGLFRHGILCAPAVANHCAQIFRRLHDEN